ncbi:MAG: hypothetical protein ABI574_17480, partial [Burkholderiales bacterium]
RFNGDQTLPRWSGLKHTSVSRWLGPLIPANYLPIAAAQVAQVLVQDVKAAPTGRRVLLSAELQRG